MIVLYLRPMKRCQWLYMPLSSLWSWFTVLLWMVRGFTGFPRQLFLQRLHMGDTLCPGTTILPQLTTGLKPHPGLLEHYAFVCPSSGPFQGRRPKTAMEKSTRQRKRVRNRAREARSGRRCTQSSSRSRRRQQQRPQWRRAATSSCRLCGRQEQQQQRRRRRLGRCRRRGS